MFMENRVTRRRFLELSAAGSAALGLSGLLPSGCATYPSPPSGLKVLNGKEYSVLKALAARLIPRGGAFPAGAEDVDVARLLDDFMAGEDEENQKQFKTALALFEHGPLFFSFTPGRFTDLSDEGKDDYIRGWATSRLGLRRTIYTAFKKATFMTFYAQSTAWPVIGYDGPWVK